MSELTNANNFATAAYEYLSPTLSGISADTMAVVSGPGAATPAAGEGAPFMPHPKRKNLISIMAMDGCSPEPSSAPVVASSTSQNDDKSCAGRYSLSFFLIMSATITVLYEVI